MSIEWWFSMRTVIVVCGVLVVAIGLGTVFTVAKAQQAVPPRVVPVLAPQMMPGEPLTAKRCELYTAEERYGQCRDGSVTMSGRDGKIRHVTMDTQNTDLNIGQVLAEWGTPVGADYTRQGVVAVYWLDRYVNVLPDEPFNPRTRVVSMTYSSYRFAPQMHHSWRGFMVSRGR
jgi:hypothetical protein